MDTLGEWLPAGPEQPSNACSTASPDTPIVIDFGSYHTRVGLNSQPQPAHSFISRAARFRDRRTGEQRSVVGYDVLLEQGARNAARSPFDGPLLTNWDSAEGILDYSFGLIGLNVENANPVAISEPLLAPHLPHRTMQEILFEGYAIPRVAFGADVLGAAHYALHNASVGAAVDKDNVLLISLGAETMHILPVVQGKPRIEDAKRINWGGRLATEFLHELLVLKYPNFPVPVTAGEVEQMLRKHCFVAQDYRAAVRECMNVDHLSQLERRVQAPVPEHAPTDHERLEKQAERRRESGRRLQEQAAVARVERQNRQQQELEQLQKFEAELSALPAEEAEAHAHYAGFSNMVDVRRTVRQLNNSLKRARGEQIEDPEPNTPLLNVPDSELDAEQIKEKRRQRLLRASYDARQRARAAKQAQQQAAEAAEAAEAEWRARDLRGWANAKRQQLDEIMVILREREKLRNDPRLRFRQTLVDAAGTAPEPKRRPGILKTNGGGAPNSVTGSASGTTLNTPDPSASSSVKPENDSENGGVAPTGTSNVSTAQTQVVEYDDEDEEPEEAPDYEAEASALQALLLEHDPEFSLEELEPKKHWHDSIVHKFLWGAHELDAENRAQQYQLNLNIERMRAVEPIFQPSIVGVDQAGLSEVVVDILRRYPQLAANIRVSGGFARIRGLKERLASDLRRELPATITVNINSSEEPELDAWRGIASWSNNSAAYVTRQLYDEHGPDYIREHQWGNPRH